MVKKTCEWWLSKNKYSLDMSTHWWQRPWVILLILFVICAAVILSLCRSPADSPVRIGDGIQLQEIQVPKFINDTIVSSSSDSANESDDDFDGDIDDNIGEDNLSAIVTPIKLHNLGLNDEDLLYESKRQGDGSTNSSQRGK